MQGSCLLCVLAEAVSSWDPWGAEGDACVRGGEAMTLGLKRWRSFCKYSVGSVMDCRSLMCSANEDESLSVTGRGECLGSKVSVGMARRARHCSRAGWL